MEKTFFKIVILSSIIVAFCLRMHGAHLETQELFAQGNNQFLKGHFALARESYAKINKKSCVVWQNIGNCFFNEKGCLMNTMRIHRFSRADRPDRFICNNYF